MAKATSARSKADMQRRMDAEDLMRAEYGEYIEGLKNDLWLEKQRYEEMAEKMRTTVIYWQGQCARLEKAVVSVAVAMADKDKDTRLFDLHHLGGSYVDSAKLADYGV